MGGDVLEFTVVDRARLDDAVRAVAGLTHTQPRVNAESRQVALRVGSAGSQALIDAVRRLDAAAVESHGLALHRPSLDDVFLAVTGRTAESDGAEQSAEQREPAEVGA